MMRLPNQTILVLVGSCSIVWIILMMGLFNYLLLSKQQQQQQRSQLAPNNNLRISKKQQLNENLINNKTTSLLFSQNNIDSAITTTVDDGERILEGSEFLISDYSLVQNHQIEPVISSSTGHYRSQLQRNIFKPLRVNGTNLNQLSLAINSNTLLDLGEPLKFLIEPHFSYCSRPSVEDEDGPNLFIIVLIHSKLTHFKRRKLIRETWGSHQHQYDYLHKNRVQLRLIFVLGSSSSLTSKNQERKEEKISTHQSPDSRRKTMKKQLRKNNSIETAIELEAKRFGGDILQSNIVDTYKNLTYKHLSGYKWLNDNCFQQNENNNNYSDNYRYSYKTDDEKVANNNKMKTFIIKCDDDTYLNITKWIELIREQQQKATTLLNNNNKQLLLACSLFPNNSLVQRNGKWALTKEEFVYDTYPQYCSGLAYLIEPKLMQHLLIWSQFLTQQGHKPLWIDDLYVTGLVLASAWPDRTRLNWRLPAPDEPIKDTVNINIINNDNQLTVNNSTNNQFSPPIGHLLALNGRYCYQRYQLDQWLRQPQLSGNYLAAELGQYRDYDKMMRLLWRLESVV